MEKQEDFIKNIISLIAEVTPEQYENYLKEDYRVNPERPFNPFSNHFYKGMNQFYFSLLNLFGIKKSSYFGTFKQITAAGGKIKKGSKALDVLFYTSRFFDKVNECYINANDISDLSQEERKNIIVYPSVKLFKVFSFDDIEDVTKLNIVVPEYDTHFTNDVNLEQNIEEFIINTGCTINFKEVQNAFYSPINDSITMPVLEAFKSSSDYYVTIFHELIHFTAPRLGRILSRSKELYSFEELVAEAGAILLSFEFGTTDKILSSCAYFKSYLTTFNDSESIILKAFKEASKASNFLLRSNVVETTENAA